MRLILLGDPVEHSRSPRIHTAALTAAGLEGEYRARKVGPDGVRIAVAELRRGELDGANVTMPHKELAAALCDRRSTEADQAGSVNTLVPEEGSVVGYSTDVDGIRAAWSWAALPTGQPVLLLGSGGAAAACLVALQGQEVWVTGRRPTRVSRLLERVPLAAGTVPWEQPLPGAVVVNATPLGMAGEALPAGVMEGMVGLFDMAYGDSATPAVAAARRRGVPAATGLDLLLAQAAASFELWTGVSAPLEVMRAAL